MNSYFIIIFISLNSLVFCGPEFRVLAPQFVCPTADDSKTSNQSYITIKSSEDLQVTWAVRWKPVAAPTQRFTIMLWRTTRDLEKKLNRPQPEHFVYIIKDSELMSGVTYIFNVTGTSHEENTTKSLSIEYSAGDQKLVGVEGRNDRFSLQLLGGQATYADLGLVLEAQVTTCAYTQDYYFEWSFTDTKYNIRNVTESGQRVAVPAFVLEPGHNYTVKCKVIKQSNGNFITESILPIQVLNRDLEVCISVDHLVVTVGKEFTLWSYISPNYEKQNLLLEWQCSYNNKECRFFDIANSNSLYFSAGLPSAGEYLITLTVSDSQQSAVANTTIIATNTNLPVIEVTPISRTVNEDSEVYLAANVSNLTPFCTLAWYISKKNVLNETSEDFQSDFIISDVTTIFALEQSFLNEIADYTNDTEQREVVGSVQAFAGRARIVANCSGYDNDGVSYADVHFMLNESPKIGDIMATHESGVALETIFRLSTPEAVDENKPIIYSFYCKLGGNDTSLLGSYMEHYAVETYLPYIENGTEVFAVACDSLGACSTSSTITVHVRPSGHNISSLLEDLSAHVRRCEILQLERLATASIVSFNNAREMDQVSILTKKLIQLLPSVHLRCMSSELYAEILNRLANIGIDVNSLLL